MFLPDEKTGLPRPPLLGASPHTAPPIFSSKVAAGFPSPADDYIEGALDLNKHLIEHPAATFIVRVEGSSMTGAGILEGDLLIVDRSREARHGHIVIAAIAGDVAGVDRKDRQGQRGCRDEFGVLFHIDSEFATDVSWAELSARCLFLKGNL